MNRSIPTAKVAHPDCADPIAYVRGLQQLITQQRLDYILARTGRRQRRKARLLACSTTWLVIAMSLFATHSIPMVWRALHPYQIRPEPDESTFTKARRRLGVATLRLLFHAIASSLAPAGTPGVFYRSLRLMGIDGVVFDVPDSAANAAAFGRPTAGPRGDGAFPQIRKLSLVELGTHVEVALIVKPCRTGEHAMVDALLPHLTPEMLLLWDRGFFSYEQWRKLNTPGVKVLARVTSRLVLRPIRTLADGSYLAKIYKGDYDRKKDRDGIIVRVIRYTLDDPQRVGHGEEHVLITNLFDEDLYPAMELILVYHERWEEELVFDEQKTHQDPRRATKPAQLRSETPAGVIQEVYALSLGHFVIRSLMFEAAATVGVDPDRLSFTGCFQILKCRLPECDGKTPETLEAWYQGLLWEMQRERTDPRRNRINPRVIKRKMSKWKKKRPEHRHRPPLKKTFPETVVMLR
jgi:hypothetical protein